MAAMVRCIWQVVHLPHSGSALVHLRCISDTPLVFWRISGTVLVHLPHSGASVVQLWCISDTSLVLLLLSGNLMQFVLLALCSSPAPPSLGCTVLSLKTALFLSPAFSSSSFGKTVLTLSGMILVASSCPGRQAAGKWQVRGCLSHHHLRRRSQSILGFLTRQVPGRILVRRGTHPVGLA